MPMQKPTFFAKVLKTLRQLSTTKGFSIKQISEHFQKWGVKRDFKEIKSIVQQALIYGVKNKLLQENCGKYHLTAAKLCSLDVKSSSEKKKKKRVRFKKSKSNISDSAKKSTKHSVRRKSRKASTNTRKSQKSNEVKKSKSSSRIQSKKSKLDLRDEMYKKYNTRSRRSCGHVNSEESSDYDSRSFKKKSHRKCHHHHGHKGHHHHSHHKLDGYLLQRKLSNTILDHKSKTAFEPLEENLTPFEVFLEANHSNLETIAENMSEEDRAEDADNETKEKTDPSYIN